jgi:hypothetical protein
LDALPGIGHPSIILIAAINGETPLNSRVTAKKNKYFFVQ